MPEIIPIPPIAAALPRFGQYCGAWAVAPDAMRAAVSMVRMIDLEAHVAARSSAPGGGPAEGHAFVERTQGGVCIIRIDGMMTKYGSSLSECAPTVEIRRAVRSAAADQMVKAIVLRIESPGGESAGTDDLNRDIAAAAAIKPVTAFIEDLGASAAYYAACGASEIVANHAAKVGAIGTYTVLHDVSAQAGAHGVKVHVVRSGRFKGIGEPGSPVTDEELAEVQRTVDSINSLFIAAVSRGRGLEGQAMDAVTDGRVFIASEALAMGLIDRIATLEEVIEESERGTAPGTGPRTVPASAPGARNATQETTAMPAPATRKPPKIASKSMEPMPKQPPEDDEEDTAGDPGDTDPMAETAPAEDEATKKKEEPAQRSDLATLQSLKAKFPDSSAEFREQCVLDGITMSAATDRFMDVLRERAKRPEQPRQSGHAPLKTAETHRSAGADAAEQIESLVQAKMAGGRTPRHTAHAAVMREHPDLRDAWVASHTAQFGQTSQRRRAS